MGEVTLSNHPFTLMLGGHPQAISLAAPMLEDNTLVELFEQLLETNIMDALGVGEKQSYASLRLSFEISIKHIKKTNPEALDLFKLIGLLPGGILQTDLTELYGSPKWKQLKDNLIRASLLVYKPSENILTLLPFMNLRAYELLEEEEDKKIEFHLKCCKFYKEFCVKFIAKMNSKIFDLSEFVNSEANIWACIYRAINRKKDNNDYDEEFYDEDDSNFMMMHSMNVADLRSLSNQLPIAFPHSAQLGGNNKAKNNEVISEESLGDGEEDINNLVDESPEHERLRPLPKIDMSKSKSTLSGKRIYFQHREGVPPIAKMTKNQSKNSMSSNEASSLGTSKLLRLHTEQSIRGSSKNLLKSISMYEADTSQLQIEESLVVHYISIVIRLLKWSDGLKAIKEYKKKKGLSKRALAHLYKLEGLLAFLSEKKEYDEARKCFHEALKLFHKIGSAKGKAICRLALVRIQFEAESKEKAEKTSTKQLISIAEKAKQQFEKVNYDRGILRANCYLALLTTKMNGEKNSALIKLKTLKCAQTEKRKAEKDDYEKTFLNDEDILLFTEILEEDDIKITIEKRHTSCSIPKRSVNTN